MPDGMDFSLPESTPPTPGTGSFRGLLWLAILLQVAVLAMLFWRTGGVEPGSRPPGPALDLDAQRDLALKLEKQGLSEAATEAWEAYLVARGDDPDKGAEIWYRIGTLHQDAGHYEPALAAYYRSESFSELPRLADELGRRVQECLEALGKFAALRYELAERTTVGDSPAAGADVVAEIGPTRVTLADLDRLSERLVVQQLGQFGGALTPAQLAQRQEELLKRLSDNRMRRQVLGQYIAEELLCRQAREDNLAADPEVAGILRQTERSILAGRMMERELSRKITITPGDVSTFYEANKDRFTEPERARLAHILLPDEQRAKAAIASLGEGQVFAALARQLSADDTSAESGGELTEMLAKGRDNLPGIGPIKGLGAAVFQTAAGTVLPKPFASDRGWHVVKVLERLPAKQRSLEESRDDARRQLRNRKEQEVRENFIRLLYKKYNVVIHNRVLGGPEGADAHGTAVPPPAPPPAAP